MPALAKTLAPTQAEVEFAWANYQALLLAEVDDPSLQESAEHQREIAVARFRFQSLFDEWSSR